METIREVVKLRAKVETIKFYRRGYFITNNHTPNQCTLEGWKGYRYKATIIAGSKLDEQGFLVDHNRIHECIKAWVEINPMMSCEETLQNLCYSVGELIITEGVELRKLGLEIAPVDENLLFENEHGELDARNGSELEQSMPAGAEYWCEFE